MKVLIIGSGGREHALAYSVAQSPEVSEVLVAPGNLGIAMDEKCENVNININDFREIYDVVDKKCINQIIVGPEQPLVDGIVDFFYNEGFNNVFGPTSAASAIEADKFFSYKLMNKLGIPQANSILCNTTEEAEKAIKKMATNKGIVIKARGLTGGKGVLVCDSKDEALFKLKIHANNYGHDVLITERLFGPECSVFGIPDGNIVVPLGISVQDHKPLFNGDKGPNTGGMGAYCPALIACSKRVRQVADEMMTPIVQEMKKNGTEYKGFLYAAVIMTKDGPKILEYNCRLGDPETQPLVMMLKEGLYEPITAALEGRLSIHHTKIKPGAACCVVMASDGYPGSYEKGFEISGLEEVSKSEDIKVFHAWTGKKNGQIITTGGRVLGVTAYFSGSIHNAQKRAYEAVNIINKATTKLNNRKVFFNRTDIASKAM